MYKKILIIADIEGSTGCDSYDASSFNTASWYDACIDMSLDINAVVTGLFDKGVEKIYVRDFHRTGYNLLPELIDKRAKVIHGYMQGPVPGIGNVYDAEAVMFIGMHASSGSGGFLAHTLTSKYSRILVNGHRVSELQLFASSLYGYSLKPVFFSGCPIACREAEQNIKNISTYPVIKDKSGYCNITKTRLELASAAVKSLDNTDVSPYMMPAPFKAELSMRDGIKYAEKKGKRWKLDFTGGTIDFTASDFDDFYNKLIRITYFTPLLEKFTPAALSIFNLYGRAGLSIVRKMKRHEIKKLLHKKQA